MVDDWGTGKSDGATGFVGISERWNLALNVDIPATTSVLAPIYTVPKGKRLVIGFLKMSCSATFIQEALMYRDSTLVCCMWFDQMVVCPVGVTSAYYFEEDEVISVYFDNTDAADHNYLGVMLGYLEDL